MASVMRKRRKSPKRGTERKPRILSRVELNSLWEVLPFAIIVWEAGGSQCFVNRRFYTLLEGQPRSLKDGWLTAIHADEREGIAALDAVPLERFQK